MFFSAAATTLDLSNFDTSNVTTMNGMFNQSKATVIVISNFNTSKVTNMQTMFYRSKAKTLNLSNFDTSNVTDMGSMFDSSEATILDVSNFNTGNVTNMSMMFKNILTTSLDLSNFDTSKVTNMYNMFNSSYNLKTIYVSNKFKTDLVTSSSNMFTNCTSLVGGAGTKYNSSYKDKTYARIDGGISNPGYFTDVADKPSTFPTDSQETIAASVKSGNIRGYKVGDTKTIDMGTYGTHTLRIANTSTPSECSTSGFSQTACGFVVEFADIITTHNMNPTGKYNGKQYDYGWNKDGWHASSMYTFVNTDIYNALPNDLRNVIIDTMTVSGRGSEDTEDFTSTDKLYLLSPKEIYLSWSYSYDTIKDLTRQLDYYITQRATTTNYSGAIKKNGTSAYDWWLRAADSNFDDYFYRVSGDGDWYTDDGSITIGVAPAFRIG